MTRHRAVLSVKFAMRCATFGWRRAARDRSNVIVSVTPATDSFHNSVR
jgi:hypothetical protein